MTFKRQATGRQGEEIAADYLKSKGYRILNRNFRCRLGEIDIIAVDREQLVFIEVRAKSSDRYGLARESIHGQKQARLRRLAAYYLQAEGKTSQNCRFDVVAVQFDREGKLVEVEHIEDAF
ncbi:MAG: YraN family protein [Peptococcaceae bacterium]|nr:MAG: YraN family protein [Peptococcaceae bacterium]